MRLESLGVPTEMFFVEAVKICFFVIQSHFFTCQHVTEISFTESFSVHLGR